MTHDARAARLAELAAEDQRILADTTIPRADKTARRADIAAQMATIMTHRKAHHAQAVNKISAMEQRNRRIG